MRKHRRAYPASGQLAPGRALLSEHAAVRGSTSSLRGREECVRGAADGRGGGHKGREKRSVSRYMMWGGGGGVIGLLFTS